MAVREEFPDAEIIGYQHNVVPQASANMFISKQEQELAPLPDKILSIGNEPKRIMEKYGSYNKGHIECSCGLRFEYLFDKLPSERYRTGNILLALEGIEKVYHMVDYVLKELKDNKRYRATIRTHPVLPWSYFQKKFGYDLSTHSNITVSEGKSLYDDIQTADIVMYWGTTVAVEALSVGKPVIHFDMGSTLSFDPLFECSSLRWKVSESEALGPVIEEIYALSNNEFETQRKQALAYLGEYFYPIEDKYLAKFIS